MRRRNGVPSCSPARRFEEAGHEWTIARERAEAILGSRDRDSNCGNVASVTADAAYDTVAFYDAAGSGGAKEVIPTAKTASVSRRGRRSGARDRTIIGNALRARTSGGRQTEALLACNVLNRMSGPAVRGESPAAFDRRCIPPAYVASRSNTAGIFPRRALPDRRITGLGATLDFHHGLLGRPTSYSIGR